jgi:SAM-dependent methyltransferase
MSDIPKEFSASYYNRKYFADKKGKKFRRPNGTINHWGYRNPKAEFLGAREIVKAWKTIFNPRNALDAFCGRGTFVAYMRDFGIEAYGFDFSEFAINNPYPRCKREWLKLHDGTKRWPYGDKEFDLVVMLDAYEHLYVDDIPFVIDEMYRVAKKWVFLQIAVAGSGGLQGENEKGYILKKGEPVPVELEGCAVAGHCTVVTRQTWESWLDRDCVIPRRDLVQWFCGLVDPHIISNWLKNAILVYEKLE